MSLIEKALKQADKEKKNNNAVGDILPRQIFLSPSGKKWFFGSFPVFFILFLFPFLASIVFFCYESWERPVKPLQTISLKAISVLHPPRRPLPPEPATRSSTGEKVLSEPSPVPEKSEEIARKVSPKPEEKDVKKAVPFPAPSPLVSPSPNLSLIHFEKGKELLNQGTLSQAREEFQASLVLNPLNPYAHNNLGIIYQKEGNLLKAEEEFLQALEQDPLSEKILNNMGLNSYLLKKWDKALSYYQAALKMNQKNIETYINLALLYQRLNDLKTAQLMLNKALSLNPSQPEILYNAAVLFEEMGENGKAREYYQRFIGLSGPAHQELVEKVKNHLHDLPN